MPNVVWIQFAKMPRLGRVKTRLAATLGEEAALTAHIQLTRAVNIQLSEFVVRVNSKPNSTNPLRRHALWFALGGPDTDFEDSCHFFKKEGLHWDLVQRQIEDNLGERMFNAMSKTPPDTEMVFIVGSDFPVLDEAYLDSAINELESSDVVLGKTEDGGYGLIGMRRDKVCDFGEIRWGTGAAFNDTCVSFESRGLRVVSLQQRFDVDDEGDFKRWCSSAWHKHYINQC